MTATRPIGVDFTPRKPQVNSEMQKQMALEKVRFLFSPLMRVDCRYNLAGFDVINPGRIRVVDVWVKPIPNTKRILDGYNSSEPEFVPYRRLPGTITNSILSDHQIDDEIPTGLVDLVELSGLDPMNHTEDAELLSDLQSTLWPVNYPTAREQMEWLQSVTASLRSRAPEYSATHARMVAALDLAVSFADILYVNLVGELSLRAAGGEGAKGHRNRTDGLDRFVCGWLEREIPVIASPLVQAKAKEIREHEKPRVELAKVQCLDCGHESNVIRATGLPPKRCGQCGEFFVKDEQMTNVEEFDAATGGGKLRKSLEEKQAETRVRNGK